ncbi:phosphodiester glycosidase family protein [Paenibacillus sp. HJGM_3]|uniref:phosphodiester glycosidase family protein n=1 Tax=Paenibacillus sp. HJGM_3 TaxID=3379816 RepID=UPI00385FD94E
MNDMFPLRKRYIIAMSCLLSVAVFLGSGFLLPLIPRIAADGASNDVVPVAPGVTYESKAITVSSGFRFMEEPDPEKKPQTPSEIYAGSEVTAATYMMKINPQHPDVRLEVVSPDSSIGTKEKVTALAQRHDRENHRVVAGFNFDLFDIATGVPLGLQITEGEIVTSPGRTATTFFAVMQDRKLKIGGDLSIKSEFQAADGKTLELDGVNKIRKAALGNSAFFLTDRFSATTRSEGVDSTGTPLGVDVRISPVNPDEKLQPGKKLVGKVEAVYASNNTVLPKGKFVLTASGNKAEWIKEHVSIGDSVSISIDLGEGLNQATYAVAGADHPAARALLNKGNVPANILDMANFRNVDIHPRTVLASKDGQLYVFVFDGRQKGYSDGISFLSAARYLQSLGMEEAINADGGGSSTFAVRKPGDSALTVLNRPSDGSERPVSNALLVISTAQ